MSASSRPCEMRELPGRRVGKSGCLSKFESTSSRATVAARDSNTGLAEATRNAMFWYGRMQRVQAAARDGNVAGGGEEPLANGAAGQ